MSTNKILIAVDDSDATDRAVAYVASLIGDKPDFTVRLFHVLAPMSPELLETPGSENLKTEEKIEKELQSAQDRWVEKEEQAEHAAFTRAQTTLRQAGVSEQAIETRFSTSFNKQETAVDILEEAKASQCQTIVVGRESFSRMRELFQHHVADELVRKGHGYTIWVVE